MEPAPSVPPTLSAAEIIRRTVARAHAPERAQEMAEYAYRKRAITERLDDQGRVEERQEKLLKFQSGLGAVIEMKIDGRPISPEELKKQEAELAEKRRRLTAKSGERNDYWEMFLSQELASKYIFQRVGRQTLNNRPAFVLTFRPRPDLPVDKLADRLMNQLAGKVWIDEEDFEVARAELSLLSEATLWGGLLANLKRFDFTAERMRLPGGVWFNRATSGEFAGRKLLSSFHARTRTESFGFHKIAAHVKR